MRLKSKAFILSSLLLSAIVLTGDGYIKHKKRQLKKLFFTCAIDTPIGVGLIHKTDQIFFTVKGKIVYETYMLEDLRSEVLYPVISLASRDDKVYVNVGQTDFDFDLHQKIKVRYLLIPKYTYLSIGLLQKHLLANLEISNS